MKIDFSETFQHLSHAPIVEALLDLRAKPSVQWDQDVFKGRLTKMLPEYPKIEDQRAFKGEFKTTAGKLPEHNVVDLGWSGLRFRSQDKLQVVQFRKEGFGFSRLRPYQDWEQFITEALRLWKVFVDVMQPQAIQRIGIRFINRMPFPADGFNLEDYVIGAPQPLTALGLVRAGLLYRDTFMVPDSSYRVNLNRTIQSLEGTPPKISVILDIDVFTTAPMEIDAAALQERLQEMRWLKNKVFFGSITPQAKGFLE